MSQLLPDGIPLTGDYELVLQSEIFKAMEQYSKRFLVENKAALKGYMRKWVDDPLHQWSRQWEYPFVYSRVQQIAQLEPQLRILDAGSGITFFPYFLNENFDNVSIFCCDHDKTLSNTFRQINGGKEKSVEFSYADLRELSYEDESLDMIYSISVLEHTHEYEKIIDNFYKIIKPSGLLVVTFDISLDGTRDIDVVKATEFLNLLVKRFKKNSSISFNLHSDVIVPGIFTTLTAKDTNLGQLPWKAPEFLYRIYSFISTGRFTSWPPPLTVYCISLTK